MLGLHRFQSRVIADLLFSSNDGVSRPYERGAPHDPGQSIPGESAFHIGIEVSVSGEHGGGVLRTPPANRLIDNRNIDTGEDAEDRSQRVSLHTAGIAANEEITHVKQPEKKVSRCSRIPCPPDTPGGTAPEDAAH